MGLDCDGEGKCIRVCIDKENYYLTATRALDGGIDFTPTVPRENDPSMSRERMAVETICREASRLSRMV